MFRDPSVGPIDHRPVSLQSQNIKLIDGVQIRFGVISSLCFLIIFPLGLVTAINLVNILPAYLQIITS